MLTNIFFVRFVLSSLSPFETCEGTPNPTCTSRIHGVHPKEIASVTVRDGGYAYLLYGSRMENGDAIMERTVLVYLHAHMLGQKLGRTGKRLLVCQFIRRICGSESGPRSN